MRCTGMVILFIHFFFITLNTCAQPDNKYAFRHIDQSNGLLHNWVFSIVQDGQGFIWILNRNGLQRYDGFRFVNYPYDVNNSSGIAYSSDCSLFADKKNNRLWITHQSIETLDLLKNNFTLFDSKQVSEDSFFGFETYMDSLNHPWLVGNFGFFPGDSSFKKTTPYYLTASFLSPNKSDPFFIDPENGEAWIARWGKGILLFDKKTKRIYSHNYNPIQHPLLQLMDKKELFFVFADSRHNIWLSSSGPEFYQYNFATKKIITYSLYNINPVKGKDRQSGYTMAVLCFFEDDHHTLWLGTQNAGLLKYNKETDNFTDITTEKENKNDIQYNYSINCIFQDRDENIWLGTDKGITFFNPYREYFQSVYHDENNILSLPKYEIQQCIETSNGDILVGTWGGGITVFDNQWHFKKSILFSRPEEYNLLWSFIQNDDGTIWAGCQHGYIHIYDPVNGAMHTIHPPELNNITIRCMAKDKKGNIWMGLHDGRIAKWDKTEQKFYSYNDSLPGIQQVFAPVFNIFIDSRQHCWAGTEKGLKQFDMDRMIYSAVYTPDENNPYAISAAAVQSIEGLNDSTLAIGTLYGGLNFFNIQTRKFSKLTGTSLVSNTINKIKKDTANNIWIATDYDLYKYVPGNDKFTRYNIQQGIINSSFKPGNFYGLKDGRLLTITATEIISFNPDSLQKPGSDKERVYITGFRVYDKPVFIDSLLYSGRPVRLSYRQNFLSIEYGALNFSGLQETKYFYQLTGIDKDWVSADNKISANYTNLDPGEYLFNVKAGNDGGDAYITSFKIIIMPPFWKTAWFRITILLLALATVYFLFRRRINAVRHEVEMKQRIVETEMMALRAQMNPHFIFNCLSSIDNLIQNDEKEKATDYLAKFAKLIRGILENSKNNTIPCWKDLETLQLYLELEEFRWDKKFSYRLDIAPEIMEGDYKVPPMIIQPYVENAIHHGLLSKEEGSRILLIGVYIDANYINYLIEDNGIGRKKALEYKELNKPSHQSMGLDITRGRINLFNQERNGAVTITDLYDDNNKAVGTKVQVNLKNQP